MALATQWVGRIFAISLLMILPGVAGQWLDEQWGTGFLALVGFGVGLIAGFGVLLVMVRPPSSSASPPGEASVSRDEFDQGDGDRGQP